MKRIFKKNNKDNASNNNDDFFTLLDNTDLDESKKKAPQTVPQHALTREEVIAGFDNKKPSNVESTGALDSLKKRIVFSAEQNDTNESENISDNVFDNTEEDENGFTVIFSSSKKQAESKPDIKPYTEPVKEPETVLNNKTVENELTKTEVNPEAETLEITEVKQTKETANTPKK